MFTIPLYVILLLYFVCLAVIASFYLVFVYHLITTASFTAISAFVVILIFAITAVVVYFTFQLLAEVDWSLLMVEFNYSNWFNF